MSTDNQDNKSQDLTTRVKDIEIEKKLLDLEEGLLIEKGLQSNSPHEILKAMEAVKIKAKASDDDSKSTLIDASMLQGTAGRNFRDAPKAVTFSTLRRMSKVPVINSIIKTRKSQMSAFTEPVNDMFSTGFRIVKKGYKGNLNEMPKEDRAIIDEITEFVLNCGANQSWGRDDFNTFLRKGVEDSLVFDQMCFEVVRDRAGRPHEFFMMDSSTMRISDANGVKDYDGESEMINGYYPSFVQVIENKTVAEFYAWEMAFGTRNPNTSIYSNGYGRSELEDMTGVITSILWSDEYNSNFFRVGASPKGILRIKGGTNNPRIQSFRQQWQAMVSGVSNSWKTPVIDSENMEWIDLQKNHRDMEFGKWMEYLTKLACALYTISPEEIGFQSGGFSGGGGGVFEASNESRLKYSKDKGLRPLLKFNEAKINRMIVSQLNPNFKFEFVGIDSESKAEYQKRVLDEVTHYKTINEVRKEQNLEPIDGGDIVLNPTFVSAEQQKAMMAQMDSGDVGYDYAGEGAADGGEEAPNAEEQGTVLDSIKGNDKFDKAVKQGQVNPFAYDINQMTERLEKGEL